MVILHICAITNNPASGISKVVPEYFLYQKKHETVGILNCNDVKIDKLQNQDNVFNDNKYKEIDKLPQPFNNPDIVIFHGIYIPKYIKYAKNALKKKIPYVIVPHGSLTLNAQKTKKLKKVIGNFIIFNWFIKNAKKIHYLSEEEQKNSNNFKKQSFVVCNGVVPPKKTKTTFNKKGIRMIYVGRYDVYIKGIDILIDACAKEKQFLLENNVKINLYGTAGNGSKYIQDLILSKEVSKIIKVNDAIFDEDKINKLLENDIFIQTSRTEGQPLGIIEAMSLGLPIIATKGTTFKDIIEKNKCGFGCDTNSESVATAFHNCLANIDQLSLYGKNSHDYICKNFLWPLVSKKTIEEYKKIIGEECND